MKRQSDLPESTLLSSLSASSSPLLLPIPSWTPFVVFILGPTACGKSDFAYALMHRLRQCAVPPRPESPSSGPWNLAPYYLNTDVYQMYEGLPIVTNKPSQEECTEFQHFFVGTVPRLCQQTIRQFVPDALAMIRGHSASTPCPSASVTSVEEPMGQPSVAVVCGGTNYYMESLIFEHSGSLVDLLPRDGEEHEDAGTSNHNKTSSATIGVAREHLYDELKRIDPEMAQRIHPSNTRRVQRSLEIYHQTGQKQSMWIAEQQRRGPQCRWPHQRHLIVILTPEQATLERHRTEGVQDATKHNPSGPSWSYAGLDAMIARRCEKMVAAGLRHELQTWWRSASHPEERYHDPIRTAIGVKEFYPYLELWWNHQEGREEQKAVDSAARSEQEEEQWEICYERFVTHTRQYARTQMRWIQHRLLKRATVVELSPRVRQTGGEASSFVEEVTKGNRLTPPPVQQAYAVLNPTVECVADYILQCLQEPPPCRLGEAREPPGNMTPSGAERLRGRPSQEFPSLSGTHEVNKAPQENRTAAVQAVESCHPRNQIFHCDICDGKYLSGELQWKLHLASRGHHKKLKRMKRIIPSPLVNRSP